MGERAASEQAEDNGGGVGKEIRVDDKIEMIQYYIIFQSNIVMNKNQYKFLNRINNYAYLLEDKLGEGATGKVYQGTHKANEGVNEPTGQKVAIKVI